MEYLLSSFQFSSKNILPYILSEIPVGSTCMGLFIYLFICPSLTLCLLSVTCSSFPFQVIVGRYIYFYFLTCFGCFVLNSSSVSFSFALSLWFDDFL